MPQFVAASLAALAVLAALSSTTPAAHADIRILQYDATGRVDGVEQRAPALADQGEPVELADDPAARYEPGEVLVVDPSGDLRQQLAGLDFTVIEQLPFSGLNMNLLRLRIPEASSVPDALALLRQRFPGTLADANHLFETAGDTATATAEAPPSSWVRAVIGWPPVDERCGTGLRIGMIDAPVDTDHPALAGQHIQYRSFHGPDRRLASADHGTAVAAILVGHPSADGWGGILPGAELLAANMFEFNDSGRLVGNAVAMLKALDWMAESDVKVVNLSMAGADNKALRFALQRARSKGLVMVAAAGNWGTAERPAYPAAYDHVIAVTAFGAGGDIYEMANRGPYIDFAAPGVRLWTAVPHGGRYQSGTSFAAPYVSAQIAAESVRGAPSDAQALRDLLRKRAVDMGSPGRDDVFGWGFIEQAPPCVL